ncbi:hypothetical protein MIMGU_mgv1a0223402mg, partial [Erythranthe guttata]
STGILVDDILHLGTDTNPQDPVDVSVTFGCGKNQTGNYLTRRGLNGVFGLGMDSISIPSILASKNLVANSFSLCFVTDGTGRIEFGDKGTAEQKTTPFNLQKSNPTYDISVTKITVGNNATNLEFSATLNSGVPYSYLSDPAYSFIRNNFNSRITDKRYVYPYNVTLDYCYALRLIYIFLTEYYMVGYRLVFHREEMVLGWKESNCDYSSSNIIPPTRTRAPPQQQPRPSPPPPSGDARSSSITSGLMAVILAIFLYHFIVISS